MKKLIKATPELLAEMDALQIFGGVGIQGDNGNCTQLNCECAQQNCGCPPPQEYCTYQKYCTPQQYCTYQGQC